jgi:hypothetical protein
MHDTTQTVGRYRKQAANCIKTAQTTADPNTKLALIDMAQVWIMLADEAEQNGGLVLERAAGKNPTRPGHSSLW